MGNVEIWRANAVLRLRDHFHAGAVAAYVKRLQSRVNDQEKALGEFKLYVAEHYASQEFLNDLKREITDSQCDLGGRIDHVFHPDWD
jgi:hypothetical protein